MERLASCAFRNFRSFSSSSARLEKCVNSVTLLGRTGSGAQLRGSEDRPVVTFSLATNTFAPVPASGNSDDISGSTVTERQITQWHRVSVFRPALGEMLLNSLSKGTRVLVQGSIKYYQASSNSIDGERFNNIIATIVANDVIFLSEKRSSVADSNTRSLTDDDDDGGNNDSAVDTAKYSNM